MAGFSADISMVRKAALWSGGAALVAGIGMAWEYGRQMSYLHAVSLGLLAIAAPLVFIFAEHLRRDGHKVLTGLFCFIGVGLIVSEYTVHFAYTMGHRTRDSQETGVTNAVHKQAQDGLASEKENIAMWRKHLAVLQEQAPWAATIKAESLRDQVAVAQKEIDLETARGGCKAKCAQRMKDKADLEEKIGKIEQASKLTSQIEATQRMIDGKAKAAASTPFKSSKIVNQAAAFAQIATGDTVPSDEALSWVQLVLGAMIAFITSFLASLLLYIAFYGVEGKTKVADAVSKVSPVAGAKLRSIPIGSLSDQFADDFSGIARMRAA